MTTAPVTGGQGIRRRVAILVGFGTVAPMLLFAWMALSGLQGFSRHMQSERQVLAESMASYVDHELQESMASLSTAAMLSAEQSAEGVQRALRAVYLRSHVLDGIVVMDRERNPAWQDFRRRPAPRAALAGLKEIDQVFATGKQAMARLSESAPTRTLLLVPLRDLEGGFSRVICAVVSPSAVVWSFILRQGMMGSASAELVDLQADSHPGETAEGQVAATARLTHVPWQIVLRQPAGEVLATLGGSHPLLLLAPPVLMVLALAFAWGAARSVTEPLATLEQAAARIAAGNLEDAVPPLGGDEVGRLGRSLEAMRLALKESVHDLTRSRDQLEERVKERTRELRELLTKFVSVQEDERRRLARELHDETCQTLAALGMKLDAALAAPTAEGARERLSEARAFAGRTLAEIHGLIYDLRPSVLDDLGLFAAIRWLAEHHLGPAGIAFRCEVAEPEHTLDPEQQTSLFRAVQEAIQNVARHSGAETVLIQIEEHDGALHIEVEDDGRGFDPGSVAQPAPSGRGLGLLGMRERLSLLGGAAQVISSPGAGTRVVLSVPFRQEVRRG
jgi:signal transduction histidine kinase